jgi:hypothetical protein
VWFASAPISDAHTNSPDTARRFVTKIYSEGDLNSNLTDVYNLNIPMLFWRAHITRQNLINAVTAINTSDCDNPPPGIGCPPTAPARGYSTNPDVWVLEYAGVIAEATLASQLFDASRTSWGGNPAGSTPYNDVSKDQVSMGVHVFAPSIYRYTP